VPHHGLHPSTGFRPGSAAAFASPLQEEVLEWLHLAGLAFSDAQLEGFGIDRHLRTRPGWIPKKSLWRSIWVAYSYAYAPGNLSNPFHWITWGRFNKENKSAAKLLAQHWKAKNSRPGRRIGPRNNLARVSRKGPSEHNPHCATPFLGEFVGGGLAGSAGGTAWTGALALG